MKYYAAINERGFANSWSVLVFSSRKARDEYVESQDGHLNPHHENLIRCRAIKKSQVTAYAANYNMNENRYNKPHPFTEECWMIYDDTGGVDDIPGYMGYVAVGTPDDGERLFSR